MKTERGISGSQLDTEICQPELDPIQYLGMPDLASREPNSADSVNAMRDKILELVPRLDESKAERDSLTKKMDQMECYYESLVQELEETQSQLLESIILTIFYFIQLFPNITPLSSMFTNTYYKPQYNTCKIIKLIYLYVFDK